MKSYPIAMTIALLVLAGCASRQPSKSHGAPPQVQAQHQPQGWYLMQAPLRNGTPDTSAKLSDWQSIAYFARSTECDQARARGLIAYPSYVQVSGAGTDSIEQSQRLASSSLCVADDDPRINWFHLEWKWK
jgi:hypothetical protein